MDRTTYDVFKGTPDRKPLWLGAVMGLQRATDQMNRLAARFPGDYFIFNPQTDEVVVSIRQNAGNSMQAADPIENHEKAS